MRCKTLGYIALTDADDTTWIPFMPYNVNTKGIHIEIEPCQITPMTIPAAGYPF